MNIAIDTAMADLRAVGYAVALMPGNGSSRRAPRGYVLALNDRTTGEPIGKLAAPRKGVNPAALSYFCNR